MSLFVTICHYLSLFVTIRILLSMSLFVTICHHLSPFVTSHYLQPYNTICHPFYNEDRNCDLVGPCLCGRGHVGLRVQVEGEARAHVLRLGLAVVLRGFHVDEVGRLLLHDVLVEALVEEAGRVAAESVHPEWVAAVALEPIFAGEDGRVSDVDAPEEVREVSDEATVRVHDVVRRANGGGLLEFGAGVEEKDAATDAQWVVAEEEIGDVRDMEGAGRTEEGEGDLEGAVALQRLTLPLEALVELRDDALVHLTLLHEPAKEPLSLRHEAARPAEVLWLGHVLSLALERPSGLGHVELPTEGVAVAAGGAKSSASSGTDGLARRVGHSPRSLTAPAIIPRTRLDIVEHVRVETHQSGSLRGARVQKEEPQQGVDGDGLDGVQDGCGREEAGELTGFRFGLMEV